MNTENQSAEREPFTWERLKEFCNKLTDDQLKQEVIVPQDESYIKILYASDLGSDQYNFLDEDGDVFYTTSREDYDTDDYFDGRPFDEVLKTEKHSITPGTNVYLLDE